MGLSIKIRLGPRAMGVVAKLLSNFFPENVKHVSLFEIMTAA